jgi:hypothetical protein
LALFTGRLEFLKSYQVNFPSIDNEIIDTWLSGCPSYCMNRLLPLTIWSRVWRGQVQVRASVQHTVFLAALTVYRAESVEGITELLQSVR